MKTTAIVKTREFREAWEELTPRLQTIVNRKIYLLAQNPGHPSLKTHRLHHAKADRMFECYVSTTMRILYQCKGGTIFLHCVGGHQIVDQVHK